MEQTSKNENIISETCDIVRNGVVMEKNNVKEGFAIHLNLQYKTIKKLEIKNEELMNQNLKKFHNERKLWKL
jgi:hypothetical protein